MQKEQLMGEVRGLLETPSNEHFGKILTLILDAEVQDPELIEEVLPYVHDHLHKHWPTHVPRHVPEDLREQALEKSASLALYKLTLPLDITLIDEQTQKMLPYDYGDGGLGSIATLREHLEKKLGLAPVAVTLTSEQLQGFFPDLYDTHQEGATWFHHGDLTFTDYVALDGEHMITITGDVTCDDNLHLSEFFGMGVGGDLQAPRVDIDAMMMVEGAIKTPFAVINFGECEMDGNVLDADVALLFNGRFEDTSPTRLCLDTGSGSRALEDEHVAQMKEVLAPEVFERMLAETQKDQPWETRRARFQWVDDELGPLIYKGVNIWKDASP